jgi:hypothetical protein
MVSGFLWILFIFVPGTHFYIKQTKYTILAANPFRTTSFNAIFPPLSPSARRPSSGFDGVNEEADVRTNVAVAVYMQAGMSMFVPTMQAGMPMFVPTTMTTMPTTVFSMTLYAKLHHKIHRLIIHSGASSWRYRTSCHRVICGPGALLQICSLPTWCPPRRGALDMCVTARIFRLEHDTCSFFLSFFLGFEDPT